MPGSSGLDLLPFYAPDFYAKQLPIQRQQALSKALMESGMGDPGAARYGGLRNAGNMLAGALLGRHADTALGQLYTGPENPGAGQETGQITNAAQSNPDLQGNAPQPEQPYEGTDTLDLGLGQHNQGQPPVQAQQPPQAQSQSSEHRLSQLPGLSKQESMWMFLNDPGKFFETVANQHGPTELMKNFLAARNGDQAAAAADMQQYVRKQTLTNEQLNAQGAYPGNPGAQQTALQGGFQTTDVRNAIAAHDPNLPADARADVAAEVRKAGTQIYRPGQIVDLADGRRFQMPNEDGKFALFDKDNNPIFQGILPGATGNVQALSQAGAAGSEPEKIINVTMADGRVVPMRAGNAAGRAGNFNPQQPPPSLGKGPITGSEPQIGQSTAQAELQKGAGQAAVEDAKLQPVIQTAHDAIQHALALNDNAPDSTYLNPATKAEFAKRFGSNPYSSYKQQWDLDVNGVIVDAFKQLKSAGGRFPQALADEVVKANGVDFDQPRDARRFGLQRLDQLLTNFGAASQNTVAGMNAPGAATSTQMAPYAGAGGYKDPVATAGPPIIANPADAAKLPRGTVFQTPDGRMKRVP